MPISPLTVHDSTQLLRRIALDVDPEAGPLRELTMNGIQACQHVGGGTVLWTSSTVDGIPRLTIVDQGVGMTATDAVRYLGKIGLSGQLDTGIGANHGVGGRLSLLLASSAGVRYRTWTRPGRGAALSLGTDPETDQFGLELDERGRAHQPVAWADAPELIRQSGHGTEVVLLGRPEHPDSTKPVDPSSSPGHIRRALNTRFATVPDGVAITVDGPLEPDGVAELVTGARAHLDAIANDHGSVALTHATLHWWLQDPPPAGPAPGGQLNGGHVATLFQSELYDLQHARRGGFARMSQFGVRVAQDRVCLWLQPDENLVASSPSRSTLALHPDRPADLWPGQATLPWPQWAAEFASRMPAALAQLALDADGDGESAKDMRRLAAKALQEDPGLAPMPRYEAPTQTDSITGSDLEPLEVAGSYIPESAAARGARQALEMFGPLLASSESGRAERRRLETAARGHGSEDLPDAPAESADDGSPANVRGGRRRRRRVAIHENDLPHPRWISTADQTRPAGYLEDRVASFDAAANELTINADHRLYRALVRTLIAENKGRKRSVVETLAGRIARREWYLHLAATIIRTKQLAASEAWDAADAASMHSPEALTGALAYNTAIHGRARRAMRSRLGTVDGSAGEHG